LKQKWNKSDVKKLKISKGFQKFKLCKIWVRKRVNDALRQNTGWYKNSELQVTGLLKISYEQKMQRFGKGRKLECKIGKNLERTKRNFWRTGVVETDPDRTKSGVAGAEPEWINLLSLHMKRTFPERKIGNFFEEWKDWKW